MTIKPAVVVAAPSFGPAVVTFFGQDIPLFAMALSLGGLVLARYVAPPPSRPLTRAQGWSLTALLGLVDVAAVLTLEPGPGMAVATGVGLGFSGLLAVEFFGARLMSVLKTMTGERP